MQLHIFRSGREPDVFGYTVDERGVNLPKMLGPWMPAENGPLEVEPDASAPGIGASAPVVAGVARDGFYIARIETIERMTGVPSVE